MLFGTFLEFHIDIIVKPHYHWLQVYYAKSTDYVIPNISLRYRIVLLTASSYL